MDYQAYQGLRALQATQVWLDSLDSQAGRDLQVWWVT